MHDASSQGTREEGTRAATLAGIALTNLFGAVLDYVECKQTVIVIADLQKDWEQGAESLASILKSNDLLSNALNSSETTDSRSAESVTEEKKPWEWLAGRKTRWKTRQ